ncbi:MAG: efflux RND transporter periplasmic adaptor subunit [Bacteroidales bacterium]|nr:efflux RND transporter periplasmic adaptor subunit [Bacteroidales bacterium]
MKRIINLASAIVCSALMISCGGKDYTITYSTEQVKRGDVSTSITATGTIEPVTKVEVGTQVSGIISRIYVDYNDEVKKGQVIAELDKSTLRARLASAEAQLTSAQSDFRYQEKNLERMKELHDKQFISDDEYESATLAYDQAKAACQAQQLSVDEAKTNLGYATITSPIDGVILSREVEQGQTVAASMTTPTLFIIAQDLTDMRVIADVDEADIGGVKEGQRVTFTVDAYPNDTFEGTVTQVRQEATTESNVVTYEVVIAAPNPDLKLKPGLTASVNIYTLERNDVLTVSAKALRFAPKETMVEPGDSIQDCAGQAKLWVKEGHTLKAIPVEVGCSNGVLTEIISGINEGATCINEAKVLQEGQQDDAQQSTNNPFMPGPPNKKK